MKKHMKILDTMLQEEVDHWLELKETLMPFDVAYGQERLMGAASFALSAKLVSLKELDEYYERMFYKAGVFYSKAKNFLSVIADLIS